MALDRAKTKANVDKFLRANRIQDAVRELQKLAEDNPRDIQTLNQIGNLYLRLGNKTAAVPMLIKVAELYAKDGFATKAVASLKIATREQPENLQAWEMLGSLSEQQGFIREARLAYDQVGRLVGQSGNLDALIRVQRKVLDLEPENIKIRVQVGDNLLKLGRTDEGVREYLKAANQLVSEGLLKEAARLFERALQLSPDNIRPLEGLVKKLLSSQQAQHALEILDTLLEKHPDAESLLLLKIDALSETQRGKEAEGLCLRLLKSRPDSVAAHSRHIKLLVGANRHSEAFAALGTWGKTCDPVRLADVEALLNEVLSHAPGNLEGLKGLADVARRSGDARRLLAALSNLAATAEEQRSDQEARAAVEEMVRIDPANPLYQERLERLRGGGAPVAPAPPPAPPRPVPAAAPPVSEPEDLSASAEETGELEIEIDVGDLQMEQADVTASLSSGPPRLPAEEPPPPSPMPPAQPGRPEGPSETPPPGPSGKVFTPREAEAIREQLTEAEVFLKYGFADKAIAELQAILRKAPDHVHAHQKLISIFRKQKKPDKAVRQILKLARVFEIQGDRETRDNLVEEARALDPNSEALREFLEPAKAQSAVRPGLPELDLDLLLPAAAAPRREPADLEVEISLDEVGGTPLEEEPRVEPVEEPPVQEELLGEMAPSEEPSPEEPHHPQAPEAEVPSFSLHLAEEEIRADAELTESLEEAEFYLSQELFGEAKRALEGLEARWAGHPRVVDLRRRFDEAVQEPPAPFEPLVEAPEEAPLIEFPAPESASGGDGRSADEFVLDSGPEEALLEKDAFPEAPLADVGPAALDAPLQEEAEVLPEEAPSLPGVEAEEAPQEAPAAASPRSRTKLRVSLEELLPPDVLERDQKAFTEESGKDEFLELANELGAALEGLQSSEESLFEETPKSPEEMSFEEVFEEFKKGVEKKVGEEDYATHYNLGIAYKEMELLDEAIGEFQMAARSPQYFVECCSMLGICFRQKGLLELAEKWYRKGLTAQGFPEEVMTGIKYDLADTLEEMGNAEEAGALFREVYASDANYRDIRSRIKRLSGK
ncbi:MAG: tetratricopeptide repeat protein [Acidobacteriota bacterium]